MIFAPLPDFNRKDETQGFGEHPEYYRKYGLAAHNGVDLRCPVGTPLHALFEGYVHYGDEGHVGYGKYVQVTSEPYLKDGTRRQLTYGHLLRSMQGLEGQFVHAGDQVAVSGSSGDSTGPHVHVTYKKLDRDGATLDHDNGYHGAIDVSPFMELWSKGNTLKPS